MPNQHTKNSYRFQAIDYKNHEYIDKTFDTMADIVRSEYGERFNLTTHNVKHLVRRSLGHSKRMSLRHIIITPHDQSKVTQTVP